MSVEDLIGPAPDSLDALVARRQHQLGARTVNAPPESVAQGVTVAWLTTALEMDEVYVRRRLRACPVRGRHGIVNLYNFREAVGYLLPPGKEQLSRYLEQARPSDLPDSFREVYWGAKTKEQRYLLNARQLWHTDDVRDVLNVIWKAVREAVRMWLDTIEENTEVTPKQREIILQLGDGLLREVNAKVSEAMSTRNTRSSVEGKEE